MQRQQLISSLVAKELLGFVLKYFHEIAMIDGSYKHGLCASMIFLKTESASVIVLNLFNCRPLDMSEPISHRALEFIILHSQ